MIRFLIRQFCARRDQFGYWRLVGLLCFDGQR